MHSDHKLPTQKEPSVVPIAALGCSVGLTAASLFLTPSSSGVPASFGNIFQPLVWLMAAAYIALGLLVCVPLIITAYLRTRRGISPGTPNKIAVLISVTVLAVSVLQFLFAIFGPDI